MAAKVLTRKPRNWPSLSSASSASVSVEIVEKHFEDLERRRYSEIARAMKLPL